MALWFHTTVPSVLVSLDRGLSVPNLGKSLAQGSAQLPIPGPPDVWTVNVFLSPEGCSTSDHSPTPSDHIRKPGGGGVLCSGKSQQLHQVSLTSHLPVLPLASAGLSEGVSLLARALPPAPASKQKVLWPPVQLVTARFACATC